MRDLNESLARELRRWDGKSADDIEAIYTLCASSPGLIDVLLACLPEADLQSGASWLLKAHLEEGHAMDARQASALFDELAGLHGWETKLHVLQCLPHVAVPGARRSDVEHFIRRCLADQNKFVRAWAYNGFYLLSEQYPQYRAEVDLCIVLGMQDEAPAVKARLRNIIKSMDGSKDSKG